MIVLNKMKEVNYMKTYINRNMPGPGEKYTDQEGNLYQIICVAENVETEEKMVVYQALSGAFACLSSPIGMFMRKMELQKSSESLPKRQPVPEKKAPKADAEKPQRESVRFQPKEKTNEYQQPQEEQANPALMAFLDADTMEEKYKLIKSLQYSITDRLIDDFAVTLDLVIPDGRLDDRYQQLLSSVRTMQKFETTRFRR